jgi:hypothetical protein
MPPRHSFWAQNLSRLKKAFTRIGEHTKQLRQHPTWVTFFNRCEHWAETLETQPKFVRLLVLYAATVLVFFSFFGCRLIDSDHYQYLLHAMANSGLYPTTDWMVSTGSHNPFVDKIFMLAGSTQQILVLLFVLYLLVIFFYTVLIDRFFADYKLVEKIVASIFFAGAVELFVPTAWGSTPLLVPTFLPSLSPNPLALLAVVLIAHRQLVFASVLIAAIFFLHFAFAVLFTSALFLALLIWGRGRISLLDWLKCGAIIGVGSLIAAQPHLAVQQGSVGIDMTWVTQVMMYVRLTHMNPLWEEWDTHLNSILLIAGAALTIYMDFRPPELKKLALVLVGTILLVVSLGFAAVIYPKLLPLARPFVFRILPILQGFFALGFAHETLRQTRTIFGIRVWRKSWLVALILTPVLFLHAKNFDFRWIPEIPPDIELTKWIQRETAPQDVLLIPPEIPFIRTGSQRSVFVDYKSSPTAPKDVLEWFRRLTLISDMKAEVVEDLRNGSAKIKLGYRAKSLASLLAVARENKLQWVLIEASSRAMRDLETGHTHSAKILDLKSMGGTSYALVKVDYAQAGDGR